MDSFSSHLCDQDQRHRPFVTVPQRRDGTTIHVLSVDVWLPCNAPVVALSYARRRSFREWPLSIAAVGILVVHAWQVLGDLDGVTGEIATIILTDR
jgi:hypothetical protein